jgi:trans-aconitate methyltransferase
MYRVSAALRWRLGIAVAAPELEEGTDESVARFYRARVTDCSFVADPHHYEHVRARWVLDRVTGGQVLEIGCGNGGMTRLLAERASHVTAVDVSSASLEVLRALRLPNVSVVDTLIEHYRPGVRFDFIVMSEVIEHLRDPVAVLSQVRQWLAPGGAMLITSPKGRWDSNEHLHEWTRARLERVIKRAAFGSVAIDGINDHYGTPRWFGAHVQV